MGRVVKYLLWLIGGFIALFVLAAVALYVFFDPNDFRDEISSSVKNQTGRELSIEGDISLDLFPWLAVEVGKARLGNSPGFGDEPMASFDRASFSVRLLPVILRREVVVGAADIEGLRLNLKVDSRGVSNWSDLVPDETEQDSESGSETSRDIDINSIEIINAVVRYSDDEAGEVIELDDVNVNIGRLKSDGSPVPFNVEMDFDIQPAGLIGAVAVKTSLAFDSDTGVLQLNDLAVDGTAEGIASIPTRMNLNTDQLEVATNESQISVQPVDIEMLDISIHLDIQPFSYNDRITPTATVAIDAFSPRTLMQLFDVQPPETADPVALSRVIVDVRSQLTATAIELTNVVIKLDDTTFTGTLSVPRVATGFYQFDLTGDSIELANYMEPADASVAAEGSETVPVEIPTELIRPLNVRGKLQFATASLGNIIFQNVDLGLNSSNGKMRLYPVSSELFAGTYSGDVRIDVSGSTPSLSLDEKVAGVDLARLAQAMFDQENVTGTIDGSFSLAGSGKDMAAIQRDLSGNMSLDLQDGSYQGTDVWYELRRARAVLKGETPPEPVLPATTSFSTVRVSGTVTDGVMRSDDLFAELPYMQLTGAGQVDIPDATINYSMLARILERPEFLSDATAEELDEFTEAEIPFKISGPLASPSIKPDLEKLLKNRVEEEIKDKLQDKLKDLFN